MKQVARVLSAHRRFRITLQASIAALAMLCSALPAAAFQQIEFVREYGDPAAGKSKRLFNSARAVASQGERLLVADTDNHRIVVLDGNGKIVAKWGEKGSKPGQFRSPAGIAVDGQGMVFVSDTDNHRIQTFDSEGKFVRAFGAKGSGPREFNSPSGLAASGDLLYVADKGNSRVVVVTKEGIAVSRITLSTKNDELKEPVDVAVDAQNRIYVIDAASNVVRIFNAGGEQVTRVGMPERDADGLEKPQSIAVDEYGNIYVADTGHYKFKKFNARGAVVAAAGSRGDGAGQFREPAAIAIDNLQRVMVLDAQKNTVQLFTTEKGIEHPLAASSPIATVRLDRLIPGAVSALAFSDKVWGITNDSATVAALEQPKGLKFGQSGSKPGFLKNARGLAIDPAGNIWVADTGNDRIQKFAPDGTLAQVVGGGGSRDGEFDAPTAVDLSPRGTVFVADNGNRRIQIFSAKGVFLRAFGKGGKLAGQLNEPVDIAVDRQENVYIVDRGNDRISKYDGNGKLVWERGKTGTGEGEFKSPENILLSPDNELYVLDAGNCRVQVFDANGKLLRAFGSEGAGPGEFRKPLGLAMEDGTRIFVGDRGNNRVQSFVLRNTPAVPRSLGVQERPNEIQISWRANTETYLEAYSVYRAEMQSEDFTRIATTSDTFYIDRGLPSSKTYRYYVTSKAREGNESAASDPVKASTPRLTPATPRNLTVEARERQIVLSWRPNTEPYLSSYKIYRKAGAGEFQELATTDKTVYTDKPLSDETEYVYHVSAVGKEGDESEPTDDMSAITPKASLTVPPLELVKMDADAVYASAYKYYESHPLASVTIRNNMDKDFEQVKLTFSIKNFMDFPTETIIPKIASKEEQTIALKPVLNNKILDVTENTPLQTEIALTYYIDGEAKVLSRTFPLTLYERHAMTWDRKEKIGAFVTPKDPPLAEFARDVIRQYVDAYPNLNQNIVYARAIYDALGVLGIAYIVDPTSPYQEFSEKAGVVDYLEYPRDTLSRKSGDCDDLSTLYAAALENVGISAALVDVPGHVFLMLDTAVPEAQKQSLGMPDSLLVVRNGTIWLPVEMTMVGSSFTRAWNRGAEEYREWTAKNKAEVIEIKKAWESFVPVTLPTADGKSVKVAKHDIEAKYPDELEELGRTRLTSLSANYLATLRKKPDDADALLGLGILYGENGLYPEALEQFDKLLATDKQNVDAMNDRGNVLLLQEHYADARAAYEAALKLDPADTGIMVNLSRALLRSGKKAEAKKQFLEAQAIDPRVARCYGDLASELGTAK